MSRYAAPLRWEEIFIYQMVQAEVMENEGEFLALGWSICVGLCNRDPELRIVTELAWSWPRPALKVLGLWLERNICENSCNLALNCSVFTNTDAKLEEHHVIARENVCPATNISDAAAAAFGYIALDSESVHVPQLCLNSGIVLWAGALALQRCPTAGMRPAVAKWDTAAAQQSGTPATNSLHAISVW